jgi:hypothetical protein
MTDASEDQTNWKPFRSFFYSGKFEIEFAFTEEAKMFSPFGVGK